MKIKYFFSEAIKNLIRNKIMTTASVLTVSLCLLIVSFSYFFISNANYFFKKMENDVKIIAFLKKELSSDEIKNFATKLQKMEHIQDLKFISSKQALEDFIEQIGESNLFLGMDEDNPLNNSFEITVSQIEFQDEVAKNLQKFSEIENISYSKKIVNSFIKVNNYIKIFSAWIILILALIATIIISNTIKITVNTRRQEIGIMKYIGATDSFIRWPFIIEGILIGFLGSLISIFISLLSYKNIVDFVNTKNLAFFNGFFEFKPISSLLPYILTINFTIAFFIGLIGSINSLKKYLKV